MKLRLICFLLAVSSMNVFGQTRENFRSFLTSEVRSPKIAPPQHLHDYVVDGKLRLSLHDALVLTLENNSAIRVEEASVEAAKFSVLRAFQPFDPLFESRFSGNWTSSPSFNDNQGGAGRIYKTLTQVADLTYKQTLQTGSNFQIELNGNRYSDNSGFSFLSPYYQSLLNLQVTQPLLRNRWRFANIAPIIIARAQLQQSRATFEAQVNKALLDATTLYWGLVSAHNGLDVARKSQDAAEATYHHEKRKLELGALPALDIYRSEAEVASRRLEVIRAEYFVKQAEEKLRFTIGANQDLYIHALDIEATEQPEPQGDLLTVDIATALQQALEIRPELREWQQALAADDTNVRLAHNRLLPDLQLQAVYQGYGVGSNFNSGQVMTSGGLSTSLNQLFNFGYPGYGATLTLALPIKNRAAQAESGTALVSRHKDLYSAQQAREQITQEVSNAVYQLEQAELSMAAARTSLDLAQKTLRAEQRKAELGDVQVFFQLNAQTGVANAEAALLDSEVAYQTAVATLHNATGSLLQDYNVQISDLTK